ncbi:hypothetical protein ACFVRE_43445, partial [Streptomyces sp. NPDC057910]
MTTSIESMPAAVDIPAVSVPALRRQTAQLKFPARTVAEQWPATRASRDEVQQRLSRPPFTLDNEGYQHKRQLGLPLLLDWLEDQPGRSWQERWQTSLIEEAGADWRPEIGRWLQGRGMDKPWRVAAFSNALATAISADVLRPAPAWPATGATGKGVLVRNLSRTRDPQGFARLRVLGESD